MSNERRTTDFWTYLRKLMDANGFDTDADLSRATGISGSLISRWRKGDSKPDLSSLQRMAPHLGVRTGDLIVRAGLATPEELGMKGAPLPAPQPVDPLIRHLTGALADSSIPADERDRLRRGVTHAYDLWREWRHRPVEHQPLPQ